MSDPNEIAGVTDCDNGSLPASPCKLELNNGFVASFHGLSKRELFAAMAMQGFCAGDTEFNNSAVSIATWAVQQADALLAELAEPQEGSAS